MRKYYEEKIMSDKRFCLFVRDIATKEQRYVKLLLGDSVINLFRAIINSLP
jgi:hypothetical protein